MISKREAEYTDRGSIKEHCAICTMFREPSSCTLVKGKINSQGYCKHFKRKAKS